ncbi:glycosyl hydrolase family 12 [Colletotrichum incanum]|uniref:Glycosyl hydrolase family 12 n=1 Tax=Colletotrichum incanum TaxID=1573173 RepID=A0A161W3F0_COLIC|nr:glycosyl hydrolase family 12 [Colletotrichum incanum]OHW95714.1 glycosyl hydrolase family 12 protein [Colletotrichum incanum]
MRSIVLLAHCLPFVSQALAQVAAWGQCGGNQWTGQTTCVSGYTCTRQNDWFYQCIPGNAVTTASRPVTTTRPSTTTTATRSAQSSLCTQYAYASVDGYDLLNNLWGKDDADSGSQCTYYYGPASGGGLSWGTTWTWNGAPNNVKSYSYSNRQFTRPLLSNIKGLPTTAQWSYSKSDIRANVAYDFFTHPDSNHPNYNGEYEVMIWLNRYGGIWPITESTTGTPIAQVQLAGYTWDLYFGYNGEMKVYSFLAASGPIYNFSADVMVFFNFLASKYAFPLSNQYLLIDQFGTEAFTGQDATFYVSKFQAEVNT